MVVVFLLAPLLSSDLLTSNSSSSPAPGLTWHTGFACACATASSVSWLSLLPAEALMVLSALATGVVREVEVDPLLITRLGLVVTEESKSWRSWTASSTDP